MGHEKELNYISEQIERKERSIQYLEESSAILIHHDKRIKKMLSETSDELQVLESILNILKKNEN